MAITTARIQSSTFIPARDRCITQDGVDVVLRQTPEELVVLSYDHEAWRVSRHERSPQAEAAAFDSFRWRGTTYRHDGEPLLTIHTDDPPRTWNSLYREIASVWLPDA